VAVEKVEEVSDFLFDLALGLLGNVGGLHELLAEEAQGEHLEYWIRKR